MAGRFCGAVGKPTKTKITRASRKAKGKRTVALVKRASKVSSTSLQQRIAELTGTTPTGNDKIINKAVKIKSSSLATARNSPIVQKPVGRAAMEIVGTTTEKIIPKKDVVEDRTPAEAIGLKLLHRAVKNQSHNRLLSHQNRHDYEYRLRSVATAGVVRLFNSLAQARRAGVAVEEKEKHLTLEKVHEKKEIATKEAFLAALRQPRQMERY